MRVLVVDDDRICRITTGQQLTAAGYEVGTAEGPAEALERMDGREWDLVLTDLRMPGMDGMAFLSELKRRAAGVDVVLMTAYGTVESAVAAMQEGAVDYLIKPFRFADLEIRLRRIAEARATRLQLDRLRALVNEGTGGIIGRSASMAAVHKRIQLFASHGAPVLVTGETGTGKELVARALHDLGPRRNARFMAVACGAVPPDLAESFFFGHEKGAFTGASARRKGCFEQADGGTVLLDDVDDLAPDLQVKLLRVLQEGVVVRVGGQAEVAVDVRLVATTKVDLHQAMAEGSFRGDLYYRLRGLEINLPPLRERGDDMLLLADHFLKVLASEPRRAAATLSPGALEAVRAWRWPGNVRELRRTMEAADVLAQGRVIEAADLPFDSRRAGGAMYTLHLEGVEQVDYTEVVGAFERDLVQWAMASAAGQQTRAAAMLNLPRTTLQSRLARAEGS